MAHRPAGSGENEGEPGDMAQYILPELKKRSGDCSLFPLLAGGKTRVYDQRGIRYPLTVRSENGAFLPLFLGGIVTDRELEHIIAGIAGVIADRHRSGKFLIIGILEGARWFCTRLRNTLAQGKTSADIDFQSAFIKISSYRKGTRLGMHKAVQPLTNETGSPLPGLAAYDGIVVADDLVDSGATFHWLVEQYLPSLEPAGIEAYFLLEKKKQRRPDIDRSLQRNVLTGRLVPDEWVVGYGPDITLAGTRDLPPLHFCRGELPGGVYAFNSELAGRLTREYHQAPSLFRKKWAPYITEH
jgi:hypoxanthine-guanine phosphoribosyltransferase